METPEILPRPTVAAKTAESAWNLEIPTLDLSFFRRSLNPVEIFNKGFAREIIVR